MCHFDGSATKCCLIITSHMLPWAHVLGWPLQVKAPPEQTTDKFSKCAMAGMAVKPRKGDGGWIMSGPPFLFWCLS